MLGWYAAAGDWLKDAGPDVWAEERSTDVGVLEAEDGDGEGLELGSGCGREVDDLW